MSELSMRGHFRYLRFKTFPMTPRISQCKVFCPLLSSSEHSGVLEDSKPLTFRSVGLHPHLAKVGLRHKLKSSFKWWETCFVLFFPLQFSYVGNHPQEDLIKFDYQLDMKIENFKSPFIVWLYARNSGKSLTIKKKWILPFRAIFPFKNIGEK